MAAMHDERKDRLIRQYEEAALALMLEEHAQAQGEQLLQSFEADSAQAEPMPQALSDQCQQLIHKAYEKSRNRGICKRIVKACAMAVVVIMALFGIASATILSVEAWRVPVLNFVLANGGKFAFVDVGFNDAGLEKQFKAMVKTVEANAPEGYSFAKTPVTDEPTLLIRMINSEGEILHVVARRENTSITVDTEDAEIREVDLKGGQKGYLIITDCLYCIWHDEAKGLILSVSTMNVEPDEFWKLVNALAK